MYNQKKIVKCTWHTHHFKGRWYFYFRSKEVSTLKGKENIKNWIYFCVKFKFFYSWNSTLSSIKNFLVDEPQVSFWDFCRGNLAN